ncbi:MAG: 1,6-anhydro-N-acetylmuramyl-L-alanine amidase AmpD [Gammaproteobacteria bacterium]|nr:1,6-anhydro-N-acetylmuramyl-L-alanine amidase AmpD [Gammaproteobacteria bacterium]
MRSEFDVDVSDGLISPARLVVSDNRDARPSGAAPQMIVLHGISLPPGKFGGTEIEALFTNRLDWSAHPYFEEIRGFEVSAHLLIRRNGEVVQFVPFSERAWHAGESCFRGRDRCNDFSIGIELEGEDHSPYDDRQYEVLAPVIGAIQRAYPAISTRELAGHCDISSGRKTDPGPAFDWLRLYDALA